MMKLLRTLTVAAIVSMPVVGHAVTYQTNPQQQSQQAQQASPDQLLEQGINSIIAFLRHSGATDLNKILFFINNNIAEYFDFNYMTKLAAGFHGRQLNQEQMKKLTHKIQTLFVESLSSKLVDYAFTNRNIRFLAPQRAQFGNEVTVKAVVTHPRGFPTRIAFRFHPTTNGWKVYDLTANGQSAVLHYSKKIARLVSINGLQALVH